MASRVSILTLLLVPGIAQAADRGAAERVRDLEEELGRVSTEVDDTRLNFSERSGLIGVSEARRRYEDAVYGFLVGDFEGAATSFYILVQSRALGNADLARDSEWYLAECLYELGKHRTPEEAYRTIVEKGEVHPYYPDAVRRSLELFALLGNDQSFNTYYTTYILSGKVETTDLVTYTLAKSFSRRGETARAKSMYDSIAVGSSWYGRARYQLGVLMITEGNLKQAAAEFQKIEPLPVGDPDQARVRELAMLALGRLYYEQGLFSESTEAYAKVDRNSPEFADKLYESVWAYIKQGSAAEAVAAGAEAGSREQEVAAAEAAARWRDALGQVDNFLLAYGDHRYTARLKLVRGHLHMKLREFDAARSAYEEVIATYTPVAARLDELSQGTTKARRFVERMGDTGGTSGLPTHAVEMLLGGDEVKRAMGAYLETTRQRQEVERAERDVAELEAALASDRDTLGMFVTARNQLTLMRGSALAMRGRLLDAEIQYLRGRASGSTRTELAALVRELAAMDESASTSNTSVSRTTDRLQIYDAQVREVQQRAFRIQQVGDEAAASGRSIAEVLSSGSSKLSPADLEAARKELEAARAELADASGDLEGLQSEMTRKRVLRTVESSSIVEDGDARGSTIVAYSRMRERVAGYRRDVQDTDSAAIYAQIDRIWSKLDTLESTSAEAVRVVGAGEARETQAVRRRLAATAQKVVELRRDVDANAITTESVATRAVLQGLRALQTQFESDVIDAEKGIVDVYWLRRMENTDEQDVLVEERSAMIRALNERFRVVRENLE
jgi:tetratricopeptide (TPR) repeat protein